MNADGTIQRGGKGFATAPRVGARTIRRTERVDRTPLPEDDPAEALLRIAEEAESRGDLTLAIDAWKRLLPYVHPKPKPVEVDPESVVALASLLELTRKRADDEPEDLDPVQEENFQRILEAAKALGIDLSDLEDDR
jgi:hypothetical protein